MEMETTDKLCCDCAHYLHGLLHNPCAKGMRCVGYLNKGCWQFKEEDCEDVVLTKKCSICGEVKEITEFVYDRGYTHYCKACKPIYKESRRRKPKENE